MTEAIKELIVAVAEYKDLSKEAHQKIDPTFRGLDETKFLCTSLKILHDYISELAKNISDLTGLSSEDFEMVKYLIKRKVDESGGNFFDKIWLLEPDKYNALEQEIKARLRKRLEDFPGKNSEDERAEHRPTLR